MPSTEGLTLYFPSSVLGGPGGTDLYVATRSSLADSFTNVTLVAELSWPTIYLAAR
ncbi:hypothetical protein BH11MYX2_BH11MYX2_22570 [soil metagenome]